MPVTMILTVEWLRREDRSDPIQTWSYGTGFNIMLWLKFQAGEGS